MFASGPVAEWRVTGAKVGIAAVGNHLRKDS